MTDPNNDNDTDIEASDAATPDQLEGALEAA